MLNWIFACIYFFGPAYFTNAIPPLAKKFKLMEFLNKPVDGGKTLNGKPIFGSHKTWRGIVCGIILGSLVGYILFTIHQINNLSLYQNVGFDYLKFNGFLFGFIMSLGAVIGDLSFAFIKRRIGLMPGERFMPFDQTNYVIGNFFLFQPFLKLNVWVWITVFIATFLLHIIFNRLGFVLNLHKAKW